MAWGHMYHDGPNFQALPRRDVDVSPATQEDGAFLALSFLVWTQVEHFRTTVSAPVSKHQTMLFSHVFLLTLFSFQGTYANSHHLNLDNPAEIILDNSTVPFISDAVPFEAGQIGRMVPDPYNGREDVYMYQFSNYREPYMRKQHFERFLFRFSCVLGANVRVTRSPHTTIHLLTLATAKALRYGAMYQRHFTVLPSDYKVSYYPYGWSVSAESTGAEPAEREIFYVDILFWIQFIDRFVQRWADEDWIPTFDMRVHVKPSPETGPRLRKFKGTCTTA